jgi:hypothetical protein
MMTAKKNGNNNKKMRQRSRAGMISRGSGVGVPCLVLRHPCRHAGWTLEQSGASVTALFGVGGRWGGAKARVPEREVVVAVLQRFHVEACREGRHGERLWGGGA